MKKLIFFIIVSAAVTLIFNFTTKQLQIRSAEQTKKEWAELLANHPYNNRQEISQEDLKKIPKADRPDLAMEQEVLMTMDPALGIVPVERKLIANKKVEAFLNSKGPIPGVEWQERGPNNVGGRTRAIMFDPNDGTNKKVWSAGVAGGLWTTVDITADPPVWNHVDGFWNNIIVCCIAYNPDDTQEFYVGTGEGWFNSDAQRGGGIWKTSDGGNTWGHLTSTDPGAYNSGSHFQYVNKIVVKDDGTIFAATRGYYINTGGIMRSTDGGANWTRVLSQYTGGSSYYDWGADIEIAANGDLYASMGIYSDGQVYKSLDTDNGGSGTWTNLSGNIVMNSAKRVELACAPSNANVVYAVAHGGSGYTDVEWVKKTTDGGTNWSSLTIPLMVDGTGNHFTRGQAFYDLILCVHPTDQNYVIAGGIDLHRTTDGGTNWSGISHWYGGFGQPEVHADQHAIQFRPGASNEVIFGHDGGFTYSTDAGNAGATPTFTDKDIGYNVTQFYACAAKNEVNSHYFLTGSQDNGSQQFTLPQIAATTEVTGGDGAFCHIDQSNPDIQTTAYINNNIYRSLDGGNTFPSIISESSGHFINPSEYDSQRKILYLAANNDQLKRISGMDGTITNTNLTISVGTAQVSALKISPFNDVLFLGIENGRIYKYTGASTGSPVLSRIDNGTTPITTGGWVSSIDVGANDNYIMVTYSSYGVTSVWETTDGGTNWYGKEGDLPDIPVRWALYNPEDRDEVLLATEVGVYSTNNFGTGTSSNPEWDVSSTDLAYTRCTMLKYRTADKMVVVSTHGRGLFTSDIFVSTSIADLVVDENLSCTGSLSVQFTDASLKPGDSWAWDVDNDGTTDYTTQNPTHTYTSSGLHSVKLTVNNGIADTTKENLIFIMNGEPTVNTGCALSSNSNSGNGYDIGIFRFAIENIDLSSSHNDGYYNNYACSQWTPLELNSSYNITIRTGTYNNEGARVYIDYNDNGTFESGESIVEFPANKDGTRTLSFTTPSTGVVLDKELRLRVLSKYGSVPTGGCDIGTYGQAEDYTVYVMSDATWVGTTGSDWAGTGNWNINSLPDEGAKITIPSGAPNYPVLISDVTCKDLMIMSGASLTINPDKALTVTGLLTNEAGNSGLVIKSDATGTGSLIHNTANVAATAERYISQWTDGVHGWHNLSSPVTSQDIQPGFVSNPPTANEDFYKWDEVNGLWINTKLQGGGWNPAFGNQFVVGDGYLIAYQSIQTKNFTGTLNNSDVAKTGLTYTTASDYTGANLLGNPFPCAIKWNQTTGASGWNLSNVGSVAKIWNETNASYTDIGQGGIIPAMNGFMVMVSGSGTGSLTIPAVDRTHSSTAWYKDDPINTIKLTAFDPEGATAQECYIKFNPEATNAFDEEFDSRFLSGYAPMFFSRFNNENLSTNTLPELSKEIEIPISFYKNNSTEFFIKAEGINNLEPQEEVFLTDVKLNFTQKLNDNPVYEFISIDGDNPARFVLKFGTIGIYENYTNQTNIFDILTIGKQLYVSSFSDQPYSLSIFNPTGQLVVQKDFDGNSKEQINITPPGTYIVRVVSEQGVTTKKVFVR